MIMIRYTRDYAKASERARRDQSMLPDPTTAHVVCCQEDATISFDCGRLEVVGSDVNIVVHDVNYISATIVNDKQV